MIPRARRGAPLRPALNPGEPRSFARILSRKPDLEGRSKHVFRVGRNRCLIRMIPTLDSHSYNRHEHFEGTDSLRLDFFEMASGFLESRGIHTVLRRRVGPEVYLAEFLESPPFEVIVKNYAHGSTLRKYPSLFRKGHRFKRPVVRFDFRVDPEDQPLPDDYVRELGHDPIAIKKLALRINAALQDWLRPNVLVDFCIMVSRGRRGRYVVLSEISPDCMRIRSRSGGSLDKDLFRRGSSRKSLIAAWSRLITSLRPVAAPKT